MTPEEKALELYQKYETLGRDFTRGVSMKEHAKQSALIAIDEVLHYSKLHGFIGLTEWYSEVKQEIEKL